MSWTIDGLTYDNRKKLTIQTANVDSDLSNFPLFVKINADTDIGAVSNADGFDIRFTQSDGTTLLKYERENFAISGGAATGYFWVKTAVTTAGTGATDIYIYYRNTDTADGADATNVWDANHKIVWHLLESPAGSAPQAQDSTTNNYDGTSAGTMVSGDLVSTPLYKGWDFDGSDDECGRANPLLDGATWSVDLWVKNLGTNSTKGFMGMTSEVGSGYRMLACYFESTANNLKVDFPSTSQRATSSLTTSNWNHLVMTWDNSTSTGILYINGAAAGTAATAGFSPWGGRSKLDIGRGYNSTYSANCQIDEFRLSNSVRPAAWIKFEYYNQANADQEITWGTAESSIISRINIGDSWKTIIATKINIGDSWKTITNKKINIGDSWKTI